MDGSRETRGRAPSHGESASEIYDKDARKSGERPVVCPSSPSQTEKHCVSSPVAVDGAKCGSATPKTKVASPPASQQQKDFRLGRGELSVLLEDGAATDTGMQYYMSDLATMRRRDLVGVLSSVGQTVGKRRPTRLELLSGVCVTWTGSGSVSRARHYGGRNAEHI
ncbi:TPA: hypothetical protein ACH3X1_015796 [Trebouxia sp. C0004]